MIIIIVIIIIIIHCFNAHFPGKPGLACGPLEIRDFDAQFLRARSPSWDKRGRNAYLFASTETPEGLKTPFLRWLFDASAPSTNNNRVRLLFEMRLLLFRLERLDHLAAKFKLKCDIHEAWSRGKEDMLQAQDFKKCRLSDLKVMTIAWSHDSLVS